MSATTPVDALPWVISALALAAFLMSASTEQAASLRTPSSPSTSARAPEKALPPSATELLGGLELGHRIGEWQVKKLGITRDKQLEVALYHGDVGFAVWVTKKSPEAPLPPRETARYAVYYGGATHPIAGDPYLPALEEITRRVEQNEAAVGSVPGL